MDTSDDITDTYEGTATTYFRVELPKIVPSLIPSIANFVKIAPGKINLPIDSLRQNHIPRFYHKQIILPYFMDIVPLQKICQNFIQIEATAVG